MATTTKKTKKKLPLALAKNALEKAEGARARLLERARDDVALVVRRRGEITDAFYDIGEALLRLREDPVPRLLGRSGFAELCTKDLGISATRAGELVAVVTRVKRSDALRWGQDKTIALLSLASASDQVETPGMLQAGKLRLHSGKRLDLETTSAQDIRALAKEERSRRPSTKRGRTTTAAERAAAAQLERALRSAGVKSATVEALATRPGAISDVRIRLPVDKLETLRGALRGHVKAASARA